MVAPDPDPHENPSSTPDPTEALRPNDSPRISGSVRLNMPTPGAPLVESQRLKELRERATKLKPSASGTEFAKAEIGAIGDQGRACVANNAALLASLPARAVVAINVATGEFVSANDSLSAMDLFEARFGSEAWAWVDHNDGPVTVGGGLWALSSGA